MSTIIGRQSAAAHWPRITGTMREKPAFFEIKTRLNWRNLMRLVSVASMASLATLLAGSANAMPTPAPYHGDSAVTLAAGGCGPAYHRNIYGGCVPNGWGGGVVVAPGFYGGGYGYHGGYYHGGGAYYHGGGYYHGGRLAWRRLARRRIPRRRRPLARRLPQVIASPAGIAKANPERPRPGACRGHWTPPGPLTPR